MKKYFLLLSILLLLPISLRAETIAVEIDAHRETINAVEGVLVLPQGVVVEEIYTGNSAVLIWVVKPTFDTQSHSITFAGLTPGGFSGKRPIFTLELDRAITGAYFKTLVAYKNDGLGSEVGVDFGFSNTQILADTEVPEPFEITISSSPDLFEGRDFISFATQDKGTGIARYEYAATWLLNPNDSEWTETESPKVLTSLEKLKRIHVRAIDHSDNVRKVSTVGPYSYLTLSIGLIIIVCLALFIRRSFRSRSSSPSSYPEVF